MTSRFLLVCLFCVFLLLAFQFFKLLICYFVYVLSACMFVHYMHIYVVPAEARRGCLMDLPELELLTVVSRVVGAVG